jgi:hypothetical protein
VSESDRRQNAQRSAKSSGGWAEPLIKQVEIDSQHLLEQHRRLQQEIYVRLRSRLALINYAIGAVGGLVGIVTLLLSSQMSSHGVIDHNIIGAISFVLFLGAFVFLFFFVNFLSHSGYIYAASRMIAEKFPGMLRELEGRCNHIADIQDARQTKEFKEYCRSAKINENRTILAADFADNVFSWERYITDTRAAVQFTDSKFELISFQALSSISFVLHTIFFVSYMDRVALLPGFSEHIPKNVIYGIFACGSLIYVWTIAYCWSTRRQVMEFRNKPL